MLTIMPITNNVIKRNAINFRSVYAADSRIIAGSSSETQKMYGESLKGSDKNNSILTEIKKFFLGSPTKEDFEKVSQIEDDLYDATYQKDIPQLTYLA